MANKFKPQKVHSPSSGEFSETLMYEVLACGNIESNNNKFYCIELQKDPNDGSLRLFTHYGRIGKTNVYEVRNTINGEPIKDDDYDAIEKEYNRILKGKKRAKKDKAQYETVDTQQPSVGSTNICGKTSSSSTGSPKGDLSMVSLFDSDEIKDMIRRVHDENIHNITSMTTMEVTSSGIASPLGPLTIDHIDKAQVVLNAIKDAYGKKHDSVVGLNSKYFSMIPHPFGMSIPSDAMIADDNKFMEEYDLLEQMKAAVQVGGTDATDDQLDDIGFDIKLLNPSSKAAKSIVKMYIDSRAGCHSHLNGWNVENVFELTNNNMTNGYETLSDRYKKDEFDLFHGTMPCNVLSIMVNGLYVPPASAVQCSGRMFGNGVYGASASTKALNYATGYWNSKTRPKHDGAYMFVIKMAMGNIYFPTTQMYDGPPDGYDSIWAKKENTSLANDEFICYKLPQVKITHLLKIKQK